MDWPKSCLIYRSFLFLFVLSFVSCFKTETSNKASSKSLQSPKTQTNSKILEKAPNPPPVKKPSDSKDQGQSFQIKNVKLGDKRLKVAIADTHDLRQQGLMNRESWGDFEGMLFIFEGELVRYFWMKNTLLALSVGFLDSTGRLLEVHDMNPPKSALQRNVDRVSSRRPAKYALEVPQGWFKENDLVAGPNGSLLEILD